MNIPGQFLFSTCTFLHFVFCIFVLYFLSPSIQCSSRFLCGMCFVTSSSSSFQCANYSFFFYSFCSGAVSSCRGLQLVTEPIASLASLLRDFLDWICVCLCVSVCGLSRRSVTIHLYLFWFCLMQLTYVCCRDSCHFVYFLIRYRNSILVYCTVRCSLYGHVHVVKTGHVDSSDWECKCTMRWLRMIHFPVRNRKSVSFNEEIYIILC